MWHVLGVKVNAGIVLVGKPEGKRPRGSSKHTGKAILKGF
jgi:hypothetical protein